MQTLYFLTDILYRPAFTFSDVCRGFSVVTGRCNERGREFGELVLLILSISFFLSLSVLDPQILQNLIKTPPRYLGVPKTNIVTFYCVPANLNWSATERLCDVTFQ